MSDQQDHKCTYCEGAQQGFICNECTLLTQHMEDLMMDHGIARFLRVTSEALANFSKQDSATYNMLAVAKALRHLSEIE